MGKARVGGWLLAATLAGVVPAGAQSRFLSYGSEAQCLSDHRLAAPLCRSAFANARTAFEARTPAFPSLGQCAKAYRDCAAWPPGTGAVSSFRPRWSGVDIVDTPHEKSVTPSPLPGVKTLTFAAMPLTEFRNLDVRGSRPPPNRAAEPPLRSSPQRVDRGPEPVAPAGTVAPPPPGSGFKLEDGVLTYPAPARFQPKNLPKSP